MIEIVTSMPNLRIKTSPPSINLDIRLKMIQRSIEQNIKQKTNVLLTGEEQKTSKKDEKAIIEQLNRANNNKLQDLLKNYISGDFLLEKVGNKLIIKWRPFSKIGNKDVAYKVIGELSYDNKSGVIQLKINKHAFLHSIHGMTAVYISPYTVMIRALSSLIKNAYFKEIEPGKFVILQGSKVIGIAEPYKVYLFEDPVQLEWYEVYDISTLKATFNGLKSYISISLNDLLK